MSLASPHSSQSSLSQPSAHSNESDGYFSDVFDSIEEVTVVTQMEPNVSQMHLLSSLFIIFHLDGAES